MCRCFFCRCSEYVLEQSVRGMFSRPVLAMFGNIVFKRPNGPRTYQHLNEKLPYIYIYEYGLLWGPARRKRSSACENGQMSRRARACAQPRKSVGESKKKNKKSSKSHVCRFCMCFLQRQPTSPMSASQSGHPGYASQPAQAARLCQPASPAGQAMQASQPSQPGYTTQPAQPAMLYHPANPVCQAIPAQEECQREQKKKKKLKKSCL